MMPELHKIKLHSQAAAAGAAGKTSGSRMKEHIELSNVHFTFQKLTCHTAQVQVKVQVCVCVWQEQFVCNTANCAGSTHAERLRLKCTEVATCTHDFPFISLCIFLSCSLPVSLYPSGQLLSVVLTMLKTQLNHHLHL